MVPPKAAPNTVSERSQARFRKIRRLIWTSGGSGTGGETTGAGGGGAAGPGAVPTTRTPEGPASTGLRRRTNVAVRRRKPTPARATAITTTTRTAMTLLLSPSLQLEEQPVLPGGDEGPSPP